MSGLDEKCGIGDLKDADKLCGGMKAGVALAVCFAFFDKHLARTWDGLERGSVRKKTVLAAFACDPCQEVLTG